MEKEVRKITDEAKIQFSNPQDLKSLNELYIKFFGKSSKLSKLTRQLSKIPKSDRAKKGKLINQAKAQLQKLFNEAKVKIKNQESRIKGSQDVSAPGKKSQIGHLHLVSQAIEEIVAIFEKLGFNLQSYPEIDWDWYTFESLNMPKDHPARDDWETFFVKGKPHPRFGNQVLIPHTSNSQVREMERVKNPPIRMVNIARCYRRQIDVSHTPMFHQFEGLLIDKQVSIPQLKGTFDFFTTNFFGPSRVTRLRPHHFRFTEPSFEVDVTCGVCAGRGCRICKSGWLELGGAGMVHPKVLKSGGIDPQIYSGFAFGWGVERTIAMKTNLGDIRLLYQNDIRFLEQF